MVFDHRDGHDVENAPGVHVLGVCQFLIAPALVIGCLDFSVDLSTISAFQVNRILPVGVNGAADNGVRGLFVCNLLDIKGFLVADLEFLANFRDHILNGDFRQRQARPFPAARFEFKFTSPADLALSPELSLRCVVRRET